MRFSSLFHIVIAEAKIVISLVDHLHPHNLAMYRSEDLYLVTPIPGVLRIQRS
jgi:hypothetical protein